MFHCRCFWLLIAILSLPVTARAGLLISTESAVVPAGGDIFLDITISSDAGDDLVGFLATFRISAPSLEFASGAGEPMDLQLSDPAYLLPLALSSAVLNPPAGTVGSSAPGLPNDTYSTLDSTIDFSGVPVSAAGSLLARVHLVAMPAAGGKSFTINLIPGESFFLNSVGDELSYQYTAGIVTVSSTTPVPEPSTLGLICVGAIALAGRRIRMNARTRSAPAK